MLINLCQSGRIFLKKVEFQNYCLDLVQKFCSLAGKFYPGNNRGPNFCGNNYNKKNQGIKLFSVKQIEVELSLMQKGIV